MNCKLLKEDGKIRTYIQEKTGNEFQTELIHTDPNGAQWYGFRDLFKIPYIRIAYAKQIADLYTTGLALADILEWCSKEKVLLKGNDPEKYEKLYSMVLDKENLAKSTADPLQQHLGLCTVYVLADDERIDYFDLNISQGKMSRWRLFPETTAFFLSWHTAHIHNYITHYNSTSKTASSLSSQLGYEESTQQRL
jgi:hypothetical protein